KTGLAKGLIKVRHNSEKLGRSRVFSFFLKEKLPYNQIFQSGRATAPLFCSAMFCKRTPIWRDNVL
ncbi:MAG: hypothetical protein UF438_02285, partial [Oribacterium sp.]|nr:hypothetical protein [Oribacterium sp.]